MGDDMPTYEELKDIREEFRDLCEYANKRFDQINQKFDQIDQNLKDINQVIDDSENRITRSEKAYVVASLGTDPEIYEEPCPNGRGGVDPTGRFLRW